MSIVSNLKFFGPEIALILFLVALFLSDALMPRTRQSMYPLVLTIIACLGGTWITAQISNVPLLFFSGFVANDAFGAFFRYFFFFSCAVCAYLSFGSKELETKSRMEFTLLLLCVTFGLCLMAISTHLLMLYIGIETVSILSFILAGFNRENLRSNEASFKYLVFGALASGLMLYGFSIIYGYTGSLQYGEISRFLQANSANGTPMLVSFAMVLIYSGLAYKISAFPMHFWTPDVYEGAPTPVATFFSVGPKAAGFAALIRLFMTAFSTKSGEDSWTMVQGLSWIHGVAIISAVTMIVGNLSAIGQKNVKRMLAYSSIAHVGYMLMGLVALNNFGLSSILFYLIAYCVMNLGAFWVVSVVADLRSGTDLDDFRGIGWSSPTLGTVMAIFLFSLTGIPAFAGFIGKFLIFAAVLKTPGFLWLALLGVLNSVVSLYYYSKILKAMWLERPVALEGEVAVIQVPVYHLVGIVALAIPTIVMGLYFTPVVRFAERSLSALLS